MAQPRTMFDKIWERHAITKNEAGQTLSLSSSANAQKDKDNA